MSENAIRTYRAFWPYYLREHARPLTRHWHIAGTAAAILFLTGAVLLGRPWLLAASLVAGSGHAIAHVDVTIICEAPKIGPHREAIRASIAAILGLPVAQVSVKATTTERLGFTGRGEGLAAQAIATVRIAENLE